MRKIRPLIITAILPVMFSLVLGGCANITVNTKPAGVDYSDKGNWAYFGEGDEKAADLFLIAPTVDVNDEYNMSLDDDYGITDVILYISDYR